MAAGKGGRRSWVRLIGLEIVRIRARECTRQSYAPVVIFDGGLYAHTARMPSCVCLEHSADSTTRRRQLREGSAPSASAHELLRIGEY